MTTLQQLLNKGPLLIPGAFDALSALQVQEAGFKAVYLSGGGLSVSLLGRPDVGLLTLDEVAGAIRRITPTLQIPLIADADTGFGGPPNVARAVQEIEKAGAAAIQIEDQVFPKKCGHLPGKRLIPLNEMVLKIRTAVRFRKNQRFLIIARTDARAVEGMSGALRRAEAYRQAGADLLFPEALRRRKEFQRFGAHKNLGLLMANMTEFGVSPILSADELARLGFRAVLYPMTAFRAAAFAMRKALQTLKFARDNKPLLTRLQTRRELYDLIRYKDFEK